MAEEFLRTDEVAAFWDEARRRADADQQTGYLTDAWPAAVARNRFRGELAQVDRWLASLRVRRGSALDVGCGTGVWLEQLARRFERAEGIDLSREMVASALARLAAAGARNATAAHRAVAELPVGAVYDFVFVGGLLMYVPDAELDAVVDRLAAVVAPGGVIVLRETTHAGATEYRDRPLSPGLFDRGGGARPPYRAIYRPRRTYRDALARRGLRVVANRINASYLVADVTAGELLAIDRATGGALARDRGRAERVARWIHRLRIGLVWPALAARPLIPWWRQANEWFVARRDR
jgi:SAM-dependent methyltransferase